MNEIKEKSKGITEESDKNGSERSAGFGEEENVYERVSIVYVVLCMLCRRILVLIKTGTVIMKNVN